MLRVALGQINTTVGDLKGNADRVLEFAGRAEAQGADIVCFPELTLTGYPPEDLVFRHGFVEENLEQLERVSREAPPIPLLVGYVDPGPGGRIYNAAALIRDGQVLERYHKMILPNYSVFDERRYFTPGHHYSSFDLGGTRAGIVICEDIWYREGPAHHEAMMGVQLLLTPNASPYSVGKRERRERMLCRRALENGVHIVYTNLVGGQDELVFDGGSLVFGPDGTMLARASQFEEQLLVVDLDLPSPKRATSAPARKPLATQMADPLEALPEVYGALTLAVKDYVRKTGFQEVALGLSGGVDSALVATIAADALGPQRVTGVMMPSRYSSESSVSDAETLARLLGIRTEMIPIEAAHHAMMDMLEKVLGEGAHGLVEENLQARVRGMLLMAVSNARGAMVLTTGNKSEMSTGYATLYGDMAGGFALLKDVEKTLVFRLCTWRNSVSDRDLVPNWVINKPPSAELRPGQKDTDSLPPYDVLDPILRAYVEEDLGLEEIVARGFKEDVIRKVIDLVDRSEYKRRQAPPGPRITERGLGKDRRLPIVSRYRAD